MSTASQLARRMEEVLLNGTWIANTNCKDQLAGLSWQLAIRPFQNLNTIAALAQHIHYCVAGIKQVLEGGDLTIKDKYSFDFPPIQSDKDWQDFLTTFWSDATDFIQLIKTLPEEKLAADFVKKEYGNYERNIDAIIEHSYYHLAQIVIIKKIIANEKK